MKIRLQRFLASGGVASRRASEAIITAGRVAINGEVVRELGVRVDPDADRVTVNGVPVKARRRLCVALNKPSGYLCSRSDPLRRRTVGDLLPREWSMLYPVGRLDFDTEGLLFLTNDGELCLRLTHPRYGVRKKYVATIEGRVELTVIQRLTRGVVHDGERLKAEKARLLETGSTQSVVELELNEGKHREVRRLFESLGLKVAHLRRTQIGPIKLGELPRGKWRVLSPAEIRSLLSNA